MTHPKRNTCASPIRITTNHISDIVNISYPVTSQYHRTKSRISWSVWKVGTKYSFLLKKKKMPRHFWLHVGEDMTHDIITYTWNDGGSIEFRALLHFLQLVKDTCIPICVYLMNRSCLQIGSRSRVLLHVSINITYNTLNSDD